MTTRDVNASRDEAVQALQQMATAAQELAAAATALAAAIAEDAPQAAGEKAVETYQACLKPVSRGANVVREALKRLP